MKRSAIIPGGFAQACDVERSENMTANVARLVISSLLQLQRVGTISARHSRRRGEQQSSRSTYATSPARGGKFFVPGRGLEPLRIAPPDPKSGASANFATLAH